MEVPDDAAPPNGLIKLLEEKLGLIRKMRDLAEQQRAAIATYRPELLLKILRARQELIASLKQLDEQLRPFRENWASIYPDLAIQKREAVDRLLSDIGSLLHLIIDTDRADVQLLSRRTQRPARETGVSGMVHATEGASTLADNPDEGVRGFADSEPAGASPQEQAVPRDVVCLSKAVFTVGEAAQICNLSAQTVIRAFDTGRLHGFRVPGSRFRRIPRESLVEFMKQHDIPLERLGGPKIRVLVVDDDPGLVEMFAELLERDGCFEVQTAATGFDAGRRMREFRPDVLLLDYMLPDINGNSVCRSIRRDETLRNVKIIIVSGVVDAEYVDKLREDGADDFIQKPFSYERVLRTIFEHVQR